MNSDELLMMQTLARGTDMLGLYHQTSATLPPVTDVDRAALSLLLDIQNTTVLMNIDASLASIATSLASIATSQQWLASVVTGAPHP